MAGRKKAQKSQKAGRQRVSKHWKNCSNFFQDLENPVPRFGSEVFRAGVLANWLALLRRQRNGVQWQVLLVFFKRNDPEGSVKLAEAVAASSRTRILTKHFILNPK